MAKYTVRHALLQYASKNSLGQDTYETAFRNMSVEFEDGAEADRLLALGAIVPDGEELARPGRMLALPTTATDSEILNWVSGATTPEVAELVAARPVMATRLLAAQEEISERFKAQAELLGQAAEKEPVADPSAAVLTTDNGAGLTPAPQPSTTADPAVNSPGDIGGSPAASGAPLLADDGTLSDEDADKISSGGAKQASDYISENPRHAQAVLNAESRRPDGPRTSVIRAAQAAAAFGQ